MIIKLNEIEKQRVQTLFSVCKDNMKKAEKYNSLLDKKTPVHKQAGFLPIQELDPSVYENDLFYVKVKPQEDVQGKWRLFYSSYEPSEGFVYDELAIHPEKGYQEDTRFGFFSKRFPFLAIEENHQTWMSVTPHEINTMKDSLAEVHGKAVTFGLGMGYYAFMAAQKENVSSITVIEKNPTVIALFKERLLPFFPHPEKIRVIEEDAFHYASAMKRESYDYSFVDLWHLPEDGLPLYLRMRSLEKKSPATQWVYWVETSLLSLLRRAFLFLLEEEMSGSRDEDYDFAANTSDLIINKMHFALKRKNVLTYEDVLTLMSDEELKKLSYSLSI